MSTTNPYATPEASLGVGSRPGNPDEYDETSVLSPRGRFGRAAYIHYSVIAVLVFAVFSTVVMLAMGVNLAQAQNPEAANDLRPVGFFLELLYLPIGFILLIRRLHDLNWSGWLSLISLIPLVNLAIYVPAVFFRGVEGDNDYGPPRRYHPLHAVTVWLVAILLVFSIAAAFMMPLYLANMGALK